MLDFVQRRLFSEGAPVESTISLATKNFKLAGEIMAMSILQGGQARNLFSANIFNYFCGNLQAKNIDSPLARDLCEKINRMKLLNNYL